jgi:hypothetical protein
MNIESSGAMKMSASGDKLINPMESGDVRL